MQTGVGVATVDQDEEWRQVQEARRCNGKEKYKHTGTLTVEIR